MFRRVAPILLLLSLSSCATTANAPQLSTQARAEYNLKQLVDAIGTLQMAAEGAVSKSLITQAAGVNIVQFCVDANSTLAQVPNGWYAIVSKAYLSAKGRLDPNDLTKFQPYFDTFELVLNTFKPVGA